ncbi:cupin domain-containing protein, partial [Acinetobacter pittii]|uniref:cupin domain-containing protein n=1 Tax=Acinetobacter pittii TaxID=48296 RepID=UPI00111E08A9
YISIDDKKIIVEQFSDLLMLSQYTRIPLHIFFTAHISSVNSLPSLVTISRKDTLYSRIKIEPNSSYHYRHVMITNQDPNLLVLRTTPLNSSFNESNPNKGHEVKEIVYILSGVVGITWSSKNQEIRTQVLEQGDSVFIAPWIPHSFCSLTPDAEILAMDYI